MPSVTTPPSCPASRAIPRIGVSERRLRNPVWMSRARSVPAFIVANRAPWMNGTASAKATKELVGKPGRRVSAFRPPELTASSSNGKTSGEITFAGCRTVRTTERLPSWKTWSARTLKPVLQRALAAAARLHRRRSPRASDLRQEHVVERRLVEPQVCNIDSRVVERPDDVGKADLSRIQTDRDALRRAAGIPETGKHVGQSRRVVGIGRDRLDGRPADFSLELVGRALGDDVAVVDDPDAVGENVRLLEVLGCQKDGDLVLAREPGDLVPERGAALDVETGRRLVEEEHARAVHKRHREVEPALHPARVAADLSVGRMRQPDARDQLVGALVPLAARQRLQ